MKLRRKTSTIISCAHSYIISADLSLPWFPKCYYRKPIALMTLEKFEQTLVQRVIQNYFIYKNSYINIFAYSYEKPLSQRSGAMLKQIPSRKHLYKFNPLKPHFYIVKLGFTGVYIIFLISARNIDCGTR